tara:strand:- start:122929 stop:123519 length:591 start_codon:yes stop_codon:yes gene_type:complete
MLVEINDKLISSDLFSEKFVCDLSACKGACCVEGDDGAPLKAEEIDKLKSVYETVKPYMTEKGIAAVEEQGVFYNDRFNEPVTTLVDRKACAFANFDEDGTAKCSIEQAYRDKKIDWKKPISCELFPVRVKKYKSFTALNYEEIDICKPACACGERLNLKVYQFLKEPLTKEFGEEFYNELKLVDQTIEKKGSEDE